MLKDPQTLFSLINNLPGYIYRVANDKDYTPLYISEKVEAITGYSPKEYLVDRTISCGKEIHKDDVENVWQIVQQAVDTKVPYECTYRIITKQGTEKWVWEKGEGIFDDTGKLLYLEGYVTDITIQKQAEVELIQNEEKFRNMAEGLSEVVFEANPDTFDTTYINRSIENIWGYSKEEWLSDSQLWVKTIFPADKERVLEEYFLSKKNKNNSPIQYRIIAKNGETKWVEDHLSWVKDSFGEVISLYGITYDITECKQKDEEIQFLVQMLDLAPSSIVIHDVEGNILYVNNKACEFHGFSKDEYLSYSIYDLNTPESKKLIKARINELLLKGEFSFETSHFRKDGSILFLEVYSKVSFKGDKRIIIGISTDITERKKSEKELIESENNYRNIVNNALVGVYKTNLKGEVLFANDYIVKMVECDSFEEMIKLNVLSYYENPKDREKSIELIKQNNNIKNYELKIKTKKGNIKYILINETLDGEIMSGMMLDITDRKYIDEKIKESEERYRALVENTTDSIYMIDINRRVLSVNRSAASLFEKQPEELFGKSIFELFPKHLADGYSASLNHVFQTRSTFKRESKLIVGEQESWIDVTLSPVKDKSGEVIAVIGVSRDITERKHADEKIKKSEEKFRNLVETTNDIIWETNTNDLYTYVSPQVEDILGYKQKEVIGKSPFDFMPDDEKEKIKKISKEIIASKKYFNGLVNINLHKNGSIVYLETSGVPIIDLNGNLIGYRGIDRNITDRIKYEEELIKAKEKALENEFFLKESQKAGRIGSFKTDFKIGFWKSSSTLDSIFGIDENYNRSVGGWLNIVHPDERKILNDYLLNDVIAKQKKFNKEYRIVRINDKQTRWVHGIGANSFDKDGNIIEMIGTIQDITERKIIEEELIKAKEKAEESDRLKSAFLANMSHEIRTPMNGILGFADLLKNPELSGEKQQDFIKIIESSGQRMLNIINDIINISKIESKTIEIRISESNVNEQIEFIHSFFKLEAQQKGIQLIVNNILNKELSIETDREKIYAILTNLVKNALKFTKIGYIELGYEIKDKNLQFFVKDTGVGIHHDQKELIFERFRQGSELHTRNYEGAGLGLSISKAYVEMLGGKIWVESEIGIGSTFYFTIPFIENQSKETQKINKTIVEMDKNYNIVLKFLIVEDDSVSEKLMSTIIESYAKEVLIAHSGTEAVQICRNNPDIDLVLMDIKIPGIDGFEATKQIRQFNKEVIIFAITAFVFEGDKEKAIKSGCNDYISKPFNQDILDKLIEKHFIQSN